jgi:TRAP transporter TAXI family solute receptor
VNAQAGGDITMVPIVTGGSVQNPRLVASGEVDIAITSNNLASAAVAGVGPYAGDAMDLKAIGALHPSILHMVVMADSPIQTFDDLEGKRVAIGPAGGGTLGFLGNILPVHGMTMDDFTPSFLSYSDGFCQLSDGNVDAALALSGFPASAVMQAAAGGEIRMIGFTAEALAQILSENKAYKTFEVSADVYGTDTAAMIIGVSDVLVVAGNTDADKVERITAANFGHLEEFAAENANVKQIDPAQSKSLTIPLHEGAARFFDK